MLILLIMLLVLFWGGGYYVGPGPIRGNNLVHVLLVLAIALFLYEVVYGGPSFGHRLFRR